jgi:hypothetical protein
MECHDAAPHIADYLGGSLPVEEVEALLIHVAACAACREQLMASGLSAMRSRFDAVLAEYQDGVGGRPRNIRPLSRCATCHYPGQSCSWICRRRFTAD